MRSSMTRLRSTKKFEIVLDSNKLKWFYMSCAAALPQLDRGSDYESERHRFESYTPHHLRLKLPATGAFLLRKHRMDSNLGRGAGVKKTRSVFSPRASTPAGGRSRCGSAQRMRGILYAAPTEIESLRQRGLFFCASLSAFVQRDDFLSTRVRFRVDVATYSRPLLLQATDQGDIPWQSVRHTSSGFSIPRSAFRRCPSSLRDAHMAWSGNSLARISMNLVMSSNSLAKAMCRFWAT